jgi:hypothetical protein
VKAVAGLINASQLLSTARKCVGKFFHRGWSGVNLQPHSIPGPSGFGAGENKPWDFGASFKI